jgi:hypothetical protein
MKLEGPRTIFVDVLISSALGAGIVLLVTHPTIKEAGAFGLGLTGILSAFGKDA